MRIAKLFLAVALLTGMAFAQQGPRGPRPQPPAAQANALKGYLQLTDQQVTDLKALQDSMREALTPLWQQLADKAKAVREERKKDSPSQATIDALHKEIVALRQQIEAKRDEFGIKSRNVLTGDQLKALNALQQALALVPAGRQAVALGLIDAPEGLGDMGRPGGMGPVPGGMGPMGGRMGARRPIRE